MREVKISLPYTVHAAALDAVLRAALPGMVIGLRSYEASQPVSVFLADAAPPAADDTVAAVVNAHDPVSLFSDRDQIAADGTDTATLTVRAPRADAAPVTLLVAGNPVPVTFTNGVAAATIRSSDPAEVAISVQNAQNRSSDRVIITAK